MSNLFGKLYEPSSYTGIFEYLTIIIYFLNFVCCTNFWNLTAWLECINSL